MDYRRISRGLLSDWPNYLSETRAIKWLLTLEDSDKSQTLIITGTTIRVELLHTHKNVKNIASRGSEEGLNIHDIHLIG